MRLDDSAIGHQLLAVLTAGVGLVAMRTQSDFFLGCLATVAAGWLLLAVGGATASGGRRRGPSVAFLVATSSCLLASFGPWSDSKLRGEIFQGGYLARHIGELWPTTRYFLRLGHLVEPRERAWVVAFDERSRLVAEVVLTADRGGAVDVEDLTDLLVAGGPKGRPRFLQGVDQSIRHRAIGLSYDNYLHACYLLTSLAVGGLAGLLVGVVPRNRTSSPPPRESPDSTR